MIKWGVDEMLVKQATLEDFDQVLWLIKACAKHYIDNHRFQFQEQCDDLKLRQQIENNEVFLLIDHNRVAGSFSVKPVESYYPVQMDQSVHMYRMVTHPLYHDKDIATPMFKHIRKKFKRKKPVLLDCWSGNDRMIEFYSNHNCHLIGDYPESDYKISVFQVGGIYGK